jgi:hypothetical protein
MYTIEYKINYVMQSTMYLEMNGQEGNIILNYSYITCGSNDR